MRRSVLGMSMLAVVLWTTTGVLAQGQGKGQGGDKERVKERPANKAQENAPAAAETADQNAGKGKAAKQADEGSKAGAQKQGGPQGKKMEKMAKDAVDQGKGKGKGQEKQAQAFQKQLQHEQAKHMERQARLARLRELAVKKGDAEMIARVDKLIAKEQEVYGRKGGKMQGQPRATPGLTGSDKAAPVTPAPNAASEQKGKGKGAKEEMKEQRKTEAKQEETKK